MMLESLDPQQAPADAGRCTNGIDNGPDGLQTYPGASPSSETLWYRVLDRLPSGVAVLDAQGAKTLWVNHALQILLRDATGATEVIGRGPVEFLPGLQLDDWESVMESLSREGVQDRDIPTRRLQFVHYATRNIAYWEWSLIPVGDTEQENRLILTVTAISDRVFNERVLASAGRAADRARRRAEALRGLTELVNASLTTPDLLSAITHQAASYFDSKHAAVLLLQPDGTTLDIGYSIGLQAADHVNTDKLSLNNSLAGRAIATRTTQVVPNIEAEQLSTLRLITGRGPASIISSPIWQGERDYGVVEVYFPEPSGFTDNSQAMLSAFADQTAIALHRADLYEQLAAQRRQLQSIVENAPVGIIYFDVDGVALSVNEAAARKYNLDAENMVGRPYSELILDVPNGLFEAALAGSPFHASHQVLESPTDGQIVCDLTLQPVRDNDGKVVGVLLLSYEVTELVQARQEADQARQSAERALVQLQATQTQLVQMEKMRAIGELASGVAHDFNNALMAILGYTELAEENLDSPEDLAEQLSIIRKAAEDASTTVDRLQRFAKQGIAAHGEPTDVNGIVEDVIRMTRPRWRDAANKEGRVYDVVTYLKPVPVILGEPSGLREVLVNLIHNALNAMPGGGKLTLSTRSLAEHQVEICVEDNGIGMTPEVAARIFDPFFTTRGVEGTGLGLAVSWTIIQRHGGVIDVDTTPGKGTRFMLRFPVGELSLTSVRSRSARRNPVPVGGIRALVVDDEPFVASVLTTILARNGYRVIAVHSAKTALECLDEDGDDPFRVMLTDHGMPGLTGLQLVAEAKRRRPALPILLLTGWGEDILQTHIMDTLPDAVLGKPINQTDLLDAISRVIPHEIAGSKD